MALLESPSIHRPIRRRRRQLETIIILRLGSDQSISHRLAIPSNTSSSNSSSSLMETSLHHLMGIQDIQSRHLHTVINLTISIIPPRSRASLEVNPITSMAAAAAGIRRSINGVATLEDEDGFCFHFPIDDDDTLNSAAGYISFFFVSSKRGFLMYLSIYTIYYESIPRASHLLTSFWLSSPPILESESETCRSASSFTVIAFTEWFIIIYCTLG